METPPPASPEALVAELTSLPGACRVPLRIGQVLVYRGHLAPGVFVAVRGGIGIDGEPNARLTAPPPIVVPEGAALDERCADTVTVLRDGEAVFLPRTIVTSQPQVRQRLAELAQARRRP